MLKITMLGLIGRYADLIFMLFLFTVLYCTKLSYEYQENSVP
jgi:hypothetical protein